MKKGAIAVLEKALMAMSEGGERYFYAAHSDEYCYLSTERERSGSIANEYSPREIVEDYPEWVVFGEGFFSICGDKYPLQINTKKIRRRIEDRLRKGDEATILKVAYLLGVDIL